MKIAFVYDRVNKWGGAERVLLALHEIWPDAPLYTAVYDSQTASWASVFPKVIPSFLQNFPLAKQNHELYAPLMPIAFESFDFDQYDVVISITSEAAKGIITKPNTLHLCYCLTPTRYLWSGHRDYFPSILKKTLSLPLIGYLRRWDQVASQRPDDYLAISQTVQERIKKYYNRESEVVCPPVDVDQFQSFKVSCLPAGRAKLQSKDKYFLVVSRLVKYKKVDLVVEAFNELRWNLKIVGAGREMGELREKAKSNIEFLGQLTDEELLPYYQKCQAVIFPQEEDFGLVPLEAQACGRPVIAFRGGGATETIVEDKTGVFFEKQTVGCLVSKLQSGKVSKFKEEDCRKQAEKFSQERFKIIFKEKVEEKWQNYQKTTFTL